MQNKYIYFNVTFTIALVQCALDSVDLDLDTSSLLQHVINTWTFNTVILL